jgi:hypothetical protein
MSRERTPITKDEFEKYKILLFARANDELKHFAKRLSDYCWNLDQYAVTQEWGGEKEALIVFGVPPEQRRTANAKNYFSIYRVADSSARSLKCEVCFPTGASRDAILQEHDSKHMLHISTINQSEGQFEPCHYEYLTGLIDAARSYRIKA